MIFSKDQYVKTAYAYIAGLKRFNEKGGDLGKVQSVASVFVSRIDSQADKAIEEKAKDTKKAFIDSLKGKLAVANSRIIYKKYLEIFEGDDFKPVVDLSITDFNKQQSGYSNELKGLKSINLNFSELC